MLSVFETMYELLSPVLSGGVKDLTPSQKMIWRKAMMEFVKRNGRLPTVSEMGVIKRRLGF